MAIFVVRHAHAGERSSWNGDDRLRPLSAKGQRQAERVARALEDEAITRLVSSPSLRCLQTLGPLSRTLAIDLDSDARFYEGADPIEAMAALEDLTPHQTVLCSHGDVIPELIDALRIRRVPVVGRGCEKGSIWKLYVDKGKITKASYLSRPD